MPTFKKTKNKNGLFDNQTLNAAVNLVIQHDVSVAEAAREHKINRITLGRYVKQARETGSSSVVKRSMVTKQVSNQMANIA